MKKSMTTQEIIEQEIETMYEEMNNLNNAQFVHKYDSPIDHQVNDYIANRLIA